MSLTSFLQSIPGIPKINVKYSLEAITKKMVEHVKHPINKYDATLIFSTGFIEFLIYWPSYADASDGKPIDCPETYLNPKNQSFKGQQRNVPNGTRLYDIDVSAMMDTLKGIVENQIKDKLQGELDFVVLRVDRDKNEIPCEVYFTSESGEKIKLNHILK